MPPRLPARSFAAALAAMALLALPLACSSEAGPGTGGGGAATGTGTGGHGGTATTTTTISTSTTTITTGAGGDLPLPATFVVTGIVTDGKAPVEGAIVMQGGGEPLFVTGPDGAYSITISTAIPGYPAVVATKIGYRAAGMELLALPEGPVDLVMRFVTPPDNPAYVYGDPGNGDPAHDKNTTFCGHCHTTQAKQFQASAHAESARSEILQDVYAGVASALSTQGACAAAGGVLRKGILPGTAADVALKCYLGDGVLPELNPGCAAGALTCDDPALDPAKKPAAFGRCADCHAGGIDGKAGGRDLHEAVGVGFENGNHCDVCHHVADVDLTKPPGVGGALRIQRSRDHLTEMPNSPFVQVLYGSLPDVPNTFMGGSYQPLFTESVFCGGCHEQRQEALIPGTALDPLRWPDGLPTHSTYSEWKDSLFNMPGTPCQFCHMPPDDTGLHNSLDVTDATNASITFGFLRTPEQLRKHTFRDPLDGSPRFIDQSVSLALSAAQDAGTLTATVQIANLLSGHAIPTGEPMRALLLLVRAEACGQALAPSGGATLDDWGGALAEGIVGADAMVNGAALTWAEAAAVAQPGQVVRAARATGAYLNYPGVGFFADPQLSPLEKGIEVAGPVGEATVVSIVNGVLTLSPAIALQVGDRLYLGEPAPSPLVDGAAPTALAGAAGQSFARTLVDPQGHRGVPHYRAVDMVSDNRIPPGAQVASAHLFPVPPGCATAKVTASLLYRPLPLAMARPRAWENGDYVIAQASKDVALP